MSKAASKTTSAAQHEQPSIGRTVHYVMGAEQAQVATFARERAGVSNGSPILTGAHLPLVITAVLDSGNVNGKVQLDGPDEAYVSNVEYADVDDMGPDGAPLSHRWHWPERE